MNHVLINILVITAIALFFFWYVSKKEKEGEIDG